MTETSSTTSCVKLWICTYWSGFTGMKRESIDATNGEETERLCKKMQTHFANQKLFGINKDKNPMFVLLGSSK